LRNPPNSASPPRPFLGKTNPCRSVVPTTDSVTRWGAPGACGSPLMRVDQRPQASANARGHGWERRIAPDYTARMRVESLPLPVVRSAGQWPTARDAISAELKLPEGLGSAHAGMS